MHQYFIQIISLFEIPTADVRAEAVKVTSSVNEIFLLFVTEFVEDL